MKDGIKNIIGKKISKIIVAENTNTPKRQVFLVFSDDTYFEFYGDIFSGAGGVDEGGFEAAKKYAENIMSAVIKNIYE